MNPDILNAVEKLPMDKRGELFTLILKKLNEDPVRNIDPMLKPIYNRAFQKPRKIVTDGFFKDEALNKTFSEFVNYRRDIKPKMTQRAITIMVNKLNKETPKEAVKMLKQSMINGWTSVYAVQKGQPTKDFDEVDYGS